MGAVRQIFFSPGLYWVLITIAIKHIIVHAIWFFFVCISVFTYPGVFWGDLYMFLFSSFFFLLEPGALVFFVARDSRCMRESNLI